MFFIYSLSLENFNVKLYDFCRTKDGIGGLLDTVARAFIRREQGERKAESPYNDDTPDHKITEDGYFLRHSSEKPNQIDVYLRNTETIPGRLWNGYNTICRKVMIFSVTEASVGLPIECTGKGVTTKSFGNSLEQEFQTKHMEELRKKLFTQRQKVDLAIEEDEDDSEYDSTMTSLVDSDDDDIPSILDTDSEEDSDYLCKNPEFILCQRLKNEDFDKQLLATKDIFSKLKMRPSGSAPPPPPPPPQRPLPQRPLPKRFLKPGAKLN